MVAAMGMTGMRTMTTNAGLLDKTPPEEIVERKAPWPVARLSPDHRAVVTELAHWTYGAMGGAGFGLLPDKIRSQPWSGPIYGLGVWVAFELGMAPLLGLHHPRQQRVSGRMVVAFDHLLYGIVVSGRLAPERAVPNKRRH